MQMKWPIGVGGLVVGALLGIYIAAWQGPSNTNDCIMSQLGDMQSDYAVEMLFVVCEDRFGRL